MTIFKTIRYMAEAKLLVSRCYCDCGKLRIATPSGAVCPEHRLVPGITESDLAAAPEAMRILDLPLAIRDGKGWRIGELKGRFIASRDGNVEAFVEGRGTRWFRAKATKATKAKRQRKAT